MSIYTNACGNIRKYAYESETGLNENTTAERLYDMDKNHVPAKKKPTSEDMGRAEEPVYKIRERIDNDKAKMAALKRELAKLKAEYEGAIAAKSKELAQMSAGNKSLKRQLGEADKRIAVLNSAVDEQQRKAKETAEAHEKFKGSNKELLKQVWGNTKNYATAKYNEDPEFYNRLALMSGGALGGAGLGALVAGKDRRLLGALGGGVIGGGAGALAHYLAKKYNYMA